MAKPKSTLMVAVVMSASLVLFNRKLLSPFAPLSESRQTSEYLGNGDCMWTPPNYTAPTDVNFNKILIAGYPSGDKRLTFLQMEALTGLAAKDEWDFKYLGITNEPFIKTNYPHHEGIWSWEKEADQVMLVVRNIRRAMVEYHDILWDIGYASSYAEAQRQNDNLYQGRPPLDDFVRWRDLRVMDEIQWYGWFIDYWMEDGLYRDIFSHRLTTPEHWSMLTQPRTFTKAELQYALFVGNEPVTPTKDPHCSEDVSGGCEPIEVISAERLMEPETGPAENRKIAEVLITKNGIQDYVIPEDAWECIWKELIENRKGLRTFIDRQVLAVRDLDAMLHELDRLINKYRGPGWSQLHTAQDLVEILESHRGLIRDELETVGPDGLNVPQREILSDREYNFSEEMLTAMITEIDRLIAKYGGPNWNMMYTAQTLVSILQEHRAAIELELQEVQSGERRLKHDDFLGPLTRQKRDDQMQKEKLYW